MDWTESAAFLFCQALKAKKRRAMATTTQSVAVSTIRCVSIWGFFELSVEVGESEAEGRPGLPLHIVQSAVQDWRACWVAVACPLLLTKLWMNDLPS